MPLPLYLRDADINFEVNEDGDVIVTRDDYEIGFCFALDRSDLVVLRDWLNAVVEENSR